DDLKRTEEVPGNDCRYDDEEKNNYVNDYLGFPLMSWLLA
ncbi:MAG: hypothetical protein QG618_1421, partial [Thermodesulfobacteriota bacterium]|nr:hypothetical protein [Thermodesulfobacteriota bacterium]